ncbi:MAG: SUMF1/EgtB/PvdO family nonheme iron enzyme, partial [Kiritimatiellales bacterium]
EDERAGRIVTIKQPFYMCTEEISNEIYNDLMPGHDSGYESNRSIDNRDPGFPLFEPKQPVVRISRDEAAAFCRKLGEKAGMAAALPTEDQWEWACRAGSDRPFWYGDENTDFSPYANLADRSIENFRYPHPPVNGKIPNYKFSVWYLRDERFNDGAQVSAATGSCAPNPWGLRNMHGNVAEWTCSEYVRTPGDAPLNDSYVVRGGSWDDRPCNATATSRWHYPSWRRVYNVGFRVILEKK